MKDHIVEAHLDAARDGLDRRAFGEIEQRREADAARRSEADLVGDALEDAHVVHGGEEEEDQRGLLGLGFGGGNRVERQDDRKTELASHIQQCGARAVARPHHIGTSLHRPRPSPSICIPVADSIRQRLPGG